MFDVNKTETVKCQHETNNSSDSVESKRRKVYGQILLADKNIMVVKLLESHIPPQFKAIQKSGLALRMVLYFINHNTFTTVQRFDGKMTIAVDIAEARWNTQQSFADIFGVKFDDIKKIEKVLKESILVGVCEQDGWTRHRYLAFSQIFMAWLKVGADLPNMKKVNDNAWGRILPIDGEESYPSMGKKKPHENKPLRINQTRIDDDEQAMPNVPTPPPTPSPEKASSYLKSSKQSECTKDQIFGLTDRLTIIGNKPYPEINEFWNEAIKEFGFKACDQLLKMEHKFRWSPECQKSILRSLSEISDPEAYAEKKIALEASQEAKRQDVWIRSDWQGYIYGIEKGTIPIKPASPIPDDLQESLNKALMQTNHNNKQDKPKDSKIMLSYLSSICPEAAKNIKPRMK